MYFEAETLDDLLRDVYKELIERPFEINATRSKQYGSTSEIIGASLCLRNPRARLSRTESKGTIFSALGELLWYLSKDSSLEFIVYYIGSRYKQESEDGATVYGAYGPRFFNASNQFNQIANVIKLLKKKSSTRRAVIQIFDAKDLAKERVEIPCTCTLQFLIRDNRLHLVTYMRSNDAFIGLPHDVFAFTMIQEIMARSISEKVELGHYYHNVGSLHLYDTNKEKALKYLNEGYQSTKLIMPEMQKEDPWPSIKILLSEENRLRSGNNYDLSYRHDTFWKNLASLLRIFRILKDKPLNSDQLNLINEIKEEEFTTDIFNIYIDKKLQLLRTI